MQFAITTPRLDVASSVSEIDLGTGVGQSLDQRMFTEWARFSEHISNTQASVAQTIGDTSSSPDKLLSAQMELSRTTLEVSYASICVRKACNVVETLLKA